MLVGAIAIFQLTELNIKTNPPCFQCARARARANDAIIMRAQIHIPRHASSARAKY